jgi:hypothetical protein
MRELQVWLEELGRPGGPRRHVGAQQVAGGVALRVQVDHQGAQPLLALMAARLQVMVDLPTPPFWLKTT